MVFGLILGGAHMSLEGDISSLDAAWAADDTHPEREVVSGRWMRSPTRYGDGRHSCRCRERSRRGLSEAARLGRLFSGPHTASAECRDSGRRKRNTRRRGACRRERAAARCLGAELVLRRRRRRIMEVKSSCPCARAAWWIPHCQKKLGASPEAQMAPAQALHPFLLSIPTSSSPLPLLPPCSSSRVHRLCA